MPFCKNCGKQLNDDEKYCSKCGCFSEQVPEELIVHKCPNCGDNINSFDIKCPSCGYEVRGLKAVNSIREFAEKIEAIERNRPHTPPKKGSIFPQDNTFRELTSTDEQKISLIRSYAIPNTKEDLYEFLILAESNIDIQLYDGVIEKTDARLAVSDAWLAKFEQAYQKAKLSFGNEHSFETIQDLYDKVHKKLKKTKSRIVIIAAVIFIPFIIMMAIFTQH